MKTYTFTAGQIEGLAELLESESFDYQKTWLRVGQLNVDRTITKARQIGATQTFAYEGLLDALTTGRNQIYYAPTHGNALCSRQYIRHIAARLGVAITGEKTNLQLSNGATITFLGEESFFVNYSGNVYLDEFGWFKKPHQAAKIANSMAMHAKHRKTSYTSPSFSHDAYRLMRGDFGRARTAKPALYLGDSAYCSDGVWRQSITLTQAIEQGHNLTDVEQLMYWYSLAEFKYLFECDWSQAVNANEVGV
ncbi:hypothetical protein EYY93_07015 [Hafnia paralvei]|uniref:terminase large subunit domain-containing protein n=1 Tax=Hafnia paralvei TaxID=546367 RepID=UPI00103545EE|nr:terminase family protein [Hafnia paralvei]TBM02520.1 hypothetical protein EYY93_07015 [Hafnia paralvei]